MFRALALGGFSCENSYPLIREMIWDFIHTNSERFIPLITNGDLENYLKNKRKNYWGEKKLLQSKNCQQAKQRPHIKKVFVKYIKSGFEVAFLKYFFIQNSLCYMCEIGGRVGAGFSKEHKWMKYTLI